MLTLSPEKQQQAEEIGVLKKLIVQGDKAFQDNEVSYALCLQKKTFKDDLIRFACSAMLLHDGDWMGARECVRMNSDLDKERVKKLIAWGDTIWKERKQ
jgi:hypothetical protein